MESKRTLEVPERMPQGYFKEVAYNFSVLYLSGKCSRASSWSLRGRWRFLKGVLVVFEMVDASRIHPGSYISIFKFLPSWKLVQLLGSPERHPSVIMESKRTLKVPERSLGGF